MSNYPQHPNNNMGGGGGPGFNNSGGGGGQGGYNNGPPMGGAPGGSGFSAPSSPSMMHQAGPGMHQGGGPRGGGGPPPNQQQWNSGTGGGYGPGGSQGGGGGPQQGSGGGGFGGPTSPMNNQQGGGNSGPPNYQGGQGGNNNQGGGGPGFGGGGPGPMNSNNMQGGPVGPGMGGQPNFQQGGNRLPSYPPNNHGGSGGPGPQGINNNNQNQNSMGPGPGMPGQPPPPHNAGGPGAPPPPFHPNTLPSHQQVPNMQGGMKARSPTAMGAAHTNFPPPNMNNGGGGPGPQGPHVGNAPNMGGGPGPNEYGGGQPSRAPPSHNQAGQRQGPNMPPGGFAQPPPTAMNNPPGPNLISPNHQAMASPQHNQNNRGDAPFNGPPINTLHSPGHQGPHMQNTGGGGPNPFSNHPNPGQQNMGGGGHMPTGPPPPNMHNMQQQQQPLGMNPTIHTPPGMMHQQPPPHPSSQHPQGPAPNHQQGGPGMQQQQQQQLTPNMQNMQHQPQVQMRHSSMDQGNMPEANPDLQAFLDSKSLVKTAPLSELRNLIAAGGPAGGAQPSLLAEEALTPIKMAIDGNHILGQLMKQINAEDPLWLLVGPYPPLLLPKLVKMVENLKKENVAPVFIFSGMAVHGDVESFVNTREEMIERDQIWFQVSQRTSVANDQIERAFDIVLGEDVEMMVMRYLQDELGCNVFRAPFLQWGQMVAFTLPNVRFCNCVWGPSEVLLMESVERTIVDIDFEKGEILYCDKSEVLNKLFYDMADDVDVEALFLDLALLTASHQALILLRPPLENGTLPYMHHLLRGLANRKERVSDYVCSSFPDRRVANSQTWKFLKGRCYVRHCMVLIPNGANDNLVPLSKLINNDEKVPRNMTGVLGSRLPLMMYYFQFIGLLSVSTMTTVSQNYIRDDNPVSDSVQYRHCMETVISLRTQVLYQLVQFLQSNPEYYHRVKVSWIRWYEPITAPVRRPPEIRLAHWNLCEVPTHMDLHTVNFQSVIHYSHCGTSSGRVKYSTLSQVLHAIFLKSLDLLGYFTHANVDDEFPDSQPINAEVSGMSCYSETIKTAVSQPHFVEQCVLLIELLRTKSLALTQFVIVDANNFQNPNFDTSPDLGISDAVVPLATRISSLLYLPTNSQPWPAQHYDRELMTYCVLVRNMHRTLRTTTEVIATSMFLDDSADIPVKDYAELPLYLPFKHPPNIAAGVLTRYLLETPTLSTIDDGKIPQQRMAAMEVEFPVISDLPAALKLLFEFWEDAYFVLSELHQKDNMTVDESLLNVMTTAVTMMRFRRELLFGETPQPSFETNLGGGNQPNNAYAAAAYGSPYEQPPQQSSPPQAGEGGASMSMGSLPDVTTPQSPSGQASLGSRSGQASPAVAPTSPSSPRSIFGPDITSPQSRSDQASPGSHSGQDLPAVATTAPASADAGALGCVPVHQEGADEGMGSLEGSLE